MGDEQLLKESAAEAILAVVEKKRWSRPEAARRLNVTQKAFAALQKMELSQFSLRQFEAMLQAVSPSVKPIILDEELEGASYELAGQAPSDPNYNSDITAQVMRVRDVLAHIVIHLDGSRMVSMRPVNPGSNRDLIDMGEALGKTYQRPVMIVHAKAADDSRVTRQGQPKQHYNYNDDRPDQPAVAVERKRSKKN